MFDFLTSKNAVTKTTSIIIVAIVVIAIVAAGAGYYYLSQPPPEEEGPKTLTVGVKDFPDVIDTVYDRPDPGMILLALYDPLLMVDPDGELIPWLATSWRSLEDGRIWEYTLRQNVTFHDGSPFNASSVVFTHWRGTNRTDFYGDYNRATWARQGILCYAVDEFTVRYEYTREWMNFTGSTENCYQRPNAGAVILSPTSIDAGWGPDFDWTDVMDWEIIGTGPFKFVEFVKGDHLTLEKNENYWHPDGPPAIDTLTFRFFPDDAARELALMAGDVDVITNPPMADLDYFDEKGFEVIWRGGGRCVSIQLNVLYEPLSDVRVREALNYAVDKQAIIDNVLKGYAEIMTAPHCPAHFPDYYDCWTNEQAFEYDKDKALQLLAEAGYADGFEVDLYTPTGFFLMGAEVTEAVQGYLADVGVDANIIQMEWATLKAELYKPPETNPVQMWTCAILWHNFIISHPMEMVWYSPNWPPNSFYPGFWSDERVDELIVLAHSEVDDTARYNMYKEAQQTIWADSPHIWLYYEPTVIISKGNVQNLELPPSNYVWLHWADIA